MILKTITRGKQEDSPKLKELEIKRTTNTYSDIKNYTVDENNGTMTITACFTDERQYLSLVLIDEGQCIYSEVYIMNDKGQTIEKLI